MALRALEKTTLASIIARSTGSRFESLNGVESNVAEIRAKIEAARTYQTLRDQTTVLFIDEIHRFNKAQQDSLLPHLERGTVRFIGATTHNPYFYVNSPLVSRSQIFQLEPVATDDLIPLLERALNDQERGFGKMKIDAHSNALRHLAEKADGDARKALTALELAVLTTLLTMGPSLSTSQSPRNLFNKKPFFTIQMETNITIQSQPSSNQSAVLIPMLPFIGSPKCSMPVKTHALSLADS